MSCEQDRTSHYEEGSLTLPGTVMLGTGVMIGAGIFALTGQMAQMTGVLFPLAFLAAAVIVAFSAYSYIKISNAWPSAGGIGMYLQKAYGNRLSTAFNALLMYFSMVIAQSFLARTFGSYTMQLYGGDEKRAHGPHSRCITPGTIQKHTLVYTVVLGLVLTAFFDLSRIAALGIVFYLVMDIAIHWGARGEI